MSMSLVIAIVLSFAMCLLVIREPSMPIARKMIRTFVTAPTGLIEPLGPGQLFITLILAVAVMALITWAGREAIQMIAMAAPDVASWLVGFEVATYADALITISFAAASLRLRSVARATVDIPSMTKRGRRRRLLNARRRIMKHAEPSNDNDERGLYAA